VHSTSLSIIANMSQDSPIAFVTGASYGIGRAVAIKLTQAGMRVVAVARTTSQLEELAAVVDVMPISLDVTDAVAVAKAVARVESELGPIDLLVNNAGISGSSGDTWQSTPSDWWRVFEVNVFGTFLCCQAVLPGMLARGSGRIVNLSSNAAFYPLEDESVPIFSAYLASKAAVIRFSEALASEVRAAGVSVFAISPGMVKSEMTAAIFADQWEDPEIWSPPELTAELIEFINTGAIDEISGRYIHASSDDWKSFPKQTAEILSNDLHALRMTSK
jgi:3-oxoacyl-[acyl-carrier protein] reductase